MNASSKFRKRVERHQQKTTQLTDENGSGNKKVTRNQ